MNDHDRFRRWLWIYTGLAVPPGIALVLPRPRNAERVVVVGTQEVLDQVKAILRYIDIVREYFYSTPDGDILELCRRVDPHAVVAIGLVEFEPALPWPTVALASPREVTARGIAELTGSMLSML